MKSNRLFAGSIKLGSGVVVSQGLAILSMPLLTRLYDASEFGVLTIYSSIVGILSLAVSLRYELAIPVPKLRSDAVRLLRLALVATALLTTVFSVLIWALSTQVLALFGPTASATTLAILPVGILALSVYQVLNYWALRERAYAVVAQTRIAQGLSRLLLQVGGSFVVPGATPLLLGDVAGQAAGTARLAKLLRSKDVVRLLRWRSHELLEDARRYKAFALYSLPSNLISIGVHQVMPLVLAAAFGAAPAGLFGLAYRVAMVPINLLNGTVSPAFYAEGMRARHEEEGNLEELFESTLRKLALAGAIPAVILMLGAPSLFGFVFGSEWVPAGEMVRVLTPMMYMQALVSPLSQSLLIVERQRLNLTLDIARAIVLGAGLSLGPMFNLSALATVSLFSGLMTTLYVIYLKVSYDSIVADRSRRDLARAFAS
jgi:O-antigen/teichoic acid export membrane protein